MLRNWWYTVGASALKIPIGGIIGFDGVAAPDGFSLYSVDDRYIIGASASRLVDTVGVSEVAVTTTTDGAHTGGTQYAFGENTGTGYPDNKDTNALQGDHTHDGTVTYNPKGSELNLVQATVEVPIPVNGVVFSPGVLSNAELLATLTDHQGFLKGGSDTLATAEAHALISDSNSMVHTHTYWADMDYYSCSNTYTNRSSSFAHDHALAASVFSGEIKHAVMRAWKNASGKIGGKPIILFPSDIIPVGWKKCDGTNGTIDLQDCFLKTTEDGDGTIDGDNQFTFTGDTDAFGHSHHYATVLSASCARRHPEVVEHYHSISGGGEMLPPWFALNFIIKE